MAGLGGFLKGEEGSWAKAVVLWEWGMYDNRGNLP